MNFLELCQAVRGDASIQGDGPTSVVGQVGIYAKLVRWVREAYIEIQAQPHDFDWMRAILALPVTSGVGTYDLLSGASWNRPDVRRFEDKNSWLTAAGVRTRVRVYNHAQMLRDEPGIAVAGTPTAATIRPDRTVDFNRLPIEDATWIVEARLTPERLALNDHVPMMPEQHHDVIVRKALMRYALHDGDTELYKITAREYSSGMNRLIIETVPAIEWPASRGEYN